MHVNKKERRRVRKGGDSRLAGLRVLAGTGWTLGGLLIGVNVLAHCVSDQTLKQRFNKTWSCLHLSLSIP